MLCLASLIIVNVSQKCLAERSWIEPKAVCGNAVISGVSVPFCRVIAGKRHRIKAPVRHLPATPVGRIMTLKVTGYSWGCGASGATASGVLPYPGVVANDWLPFGTRVSVPSLGYSGIVLDRGVGTGGVDLFVPTCASTYSVTGYRTVIID